MDGRMSESSLTQSIVSIILPPTVVAGIAAAPARDAAAAALLLPPPPPPPSMAPMAFAVWACPTLDVSLLPGLSWFGGRL